MERKVTWTLPAVTDVENIRNYVSLDSKEHAFDLVLTFYQASQSLAIFSHRGRIVPEINEYSIREIFIKRYRLIYEVFPERIEITAVIHMSRDFNTAWNERKT
jgi:plasmid stabilization system protein ParE